MSGPEHETLTAALRRLADEHATGVLSVATPGADVVIELEAGAPTTIGPVHDVTDRTGADAAGALTTAVVVDELVDRTVAAMVDGSTTWSWDVDSSAERVAVPDGLTEELTRRAVDAGHALGTVRSDDVLVPAADVEATGELERVRGLFDGTRAVTDVADEAGLELPVVATMAAALVEGGALAHEDQDGEPAAWDTPTDEATSWSATVAASDEDDEDEDDEPELWVMGPSDDDEAADEDEDEDDDASEVAPTRSSVASPVSLAELRDVEVPTEDVDDDLLDEDVSPAASWNDTSWLDDLAPEAEPDSEPEPATDEDRADTRAALGSVLSELQQQSGSAATDAPKPTEPQPVDEDDDPEGDSGPQRVAPPAERREPKAEPGDVAEFLRELSRLALDDD